MADRLTPAERLGNLALTPATGSAEHLVRRARAGADSEGFREFWKYTPPAAFIDGLQECTVSEPVIRGADQAGVRISRLSLGELDLEGVQDPASAERFPLADVALLMAGEVILIEVDGEPAVPLEIDYQAGLSLPLLVRVLDDARVHLIEQAAADEFLNHSLYLHLGRNARVQHAFAGMTSAGSHWTMTQVQQASGSHYQRQQYLTGANRRRSETQILLNGPDARADITGAYVVEGGTHLDQQLVVEHRARDTRSRQRFHGIGAGKGTAVFNGRIHIHPDSPQSDAALSNRNLALHPDAVINTKPELEIYTDDVRCAHGATIGQISADSLFYLRSRGLPPAAARRMLCRAFIRECIEGDLAETAEDALLGDWISAP